MPLRPPSRTFGGCRRPSLRISNISTTNVVSLAPVAGDLASYPVLIYLEGVTGYRQMDTFQVEELVSHGYIVVALDQPGAAATVVFPDGHQIPVPPVADLKATIGSSYLRRDNTRLLNGRPLEGNNIIPYFAQDVSFALDQLAALNGGDPNRLLTGRLDLQRVGALGMSLGGIVAGESCLKERRIGACLMMDAPMTFDVVAAGLRQPSMWITRKAEWMRLERQRSGGWPEDEIKVHLASMRAVYDSLPGAGYFVQVSGMFHSNFMDLPNLVSAGLDCGAQRTDRQRPGARRRQCLLFGVLRPAPERPTGSAARSAGRTISRGTLRVAAALAGRALNRGG